MTLLEWGAIGELSGGIAIIVSLIYVSLQIRLSAQAARAATMQSFSTQNTELMLNIGNVELRDIWWSGLGGMQHLKESEIVAFTTVWMSLFRMFETFFYQRKDGAFDALIFDSWKLQLIDGFAYEGTRAFWELRKHLFTAEFVEYLETEVAAGTAKPMYPEQT